MTKKEMMSVLRVFLAMVAAAVFVHCMWLIHHRHVLHGYYTCDHVVHCEDGVDDYGRCTDVGGTAAYVEIVHR